MQMAKRRALDLLRKSLNEMERLPSYGEKGENLSEWDRWMTSVRARIQSIFGDRAEQIKGLDAAFENIAKQCWAQVRNTESKAASALLESYVVLIEDTWDEDMPDHESKHLAQGRAASKRVFLVHGNDHGPLNSVARFLERLGLIPVILHEQPSHGSTVFEKLLLNSSVDYAIVILTPDDKGCLASSDHLLPRARQNVVFELGYFVAALGRGKTCALVFEGIELPSDYHGVVYIKLERNDAWKIDLARELSSQGFDIDLKKVL